MDEHAIRPVDREDEPARGLSSGADVAGAPQAAAREEQLIAAAGEGDLDLFPTERSEAPPSASEPLASQGSLLVSMPDAGSVPAVDREPQGPEPRALQNGLDRVHRAVVDRLAGALGHVGGASAVSRSRPRVSPDKLIVASGSVLFIALLLLTHQPANQDDPAATSVEPPAPVDWEAQPPVRGAPAVARTDGATERDAQETEPALPPKPRERDVARISTPPLQAESNPPRPDPRQLSQPEPPRRTQPQPGSAATGAARGSSEPASTARTRSTATPAPLPDAPPPPLAETPSAPLARELPPPAHDLPGDTADVTAASRVDASAAAPSASEIPPPPQPALEPDVRARSAAVQRVLNRYRDAFNRLDPAATRAVWPSVDMSALSRAFDQIREQNFAYDSCRITVIGDRAEASCPGTLRYVPRMGANQTRVEAREWRFTLREAGDGWAIDSVVIR